MCVAPNNIPNVGPVACRECWRCRNNRINDLVGRCIAEQQTAKLTLAVTLTYAGDTVNASTLVYADFMKFMKRLRYYGCKVRFIVAGEYGSQKGRAHWHAVLFFYGDTMPKIVPNGHERKALDVHIERRIDWEPWPHGFAYFQSADYDGFHYLLKYALKDQKQVGQRSHLSMSKRPPLGAAYFADLARRHVEQGLGPRSWEYSFGDQFDKKNKRRKFWLQGKSRENFVKEFLTLWHDQRGEKFPETELLIQEMAKGALSAQQENESENAFNEAIKPRPNLRSLFFDGKTRTGEKFPAMPPWLGGDGEYRLGWVDRTPVIVAENETGLWVAYDREGIVKTWLVQEKLKQKVLSRITGVRTRYAEQQWFARAGRLSQKL
jgi:hypothetical protein